MTSTTATALDLAAYGLAAAISLSLIVSYVRRVRGERDRTAIRRRLGLDRGQ